MAIIPWEPFQDLEKFFEDEDFFPVIPLRRGGFPAVDVSEDENSVYVEMPLAGVKPTDVEISVEDNILNVKGKIEEEKEEKKKNYWMKEIRKGAFERAVTLPTEVKAEKATAESKNGMLKITLPKSEVKKAKKVQVKVK
ncbi:MAG TPA: Hsp20/alpha crystallin family protein [Candidatus Pacearchaeota archaeon]|nr:Hsp20/alpha crystallin family protein [Candidatus Pacearchaeota archaeon]HOK94062.1 Hsp20/alpha crystallin family protein [Candidatus Pacearchaeota archaeon]HPO75133.1 Hsp20/alpha crystallin family protein [Candidatus Pacearchaeota archaeon]